MAWFRSHKITLNKSILLYNHLGKACGFSEPVKANFFKVYNNTLSNNFNLCLVLILISLAMVLVDWKKLS